MTNLVAAFHDNKIHEFERILRTNRATIMDDPFIAAHIEEVLRNIRTQVLIKTVRPYTRIRIASIGLELNIPEKEVEQLLVSLILDGQLAGHVDQIQGILELENVDMRGDKKLYEALQKWSDSLLTVQEGLAAKVGAS